MSYLYQAHNRRYRAKKVGYFPVSVLMGGLISLMAGVLGIGFFQSGNPILGLSLFAGGAIGLSLSMLYWSFLEHERLIAAYYTGLRLKNAPDNFAEVK